MNKHDDLAARIRTQLEPYVAKLNDDNRRVTRKLVAAALVLGLVAGFGLGVLVADRWGGGREVIFIPMDGTDV